MTNEQILKKAIEKAIKNGWKLNEIKGKEIDSGYLIRHKRYYFIIFSHDFAKVFWGEKSVRAYSENVFKPGGFVPYIESWQYHLQQMVLEKDPIKYLSRFI